MAKFEISRDHGMTWESAELGPDGSVRIVNDSSITIHLLTRESPDQPYWPGRDDSELAEDAEIARKIGQAVIRFDVEI